MEEVFLTNEDAVKFRRSLTKLAQHLKKTAVVTGSVATGLHLWRKGASQTNKKRLNDIDTVVEDLSDVYLSLKQDFLINHFHPTREKGKVLLQLVDEEHETRVEIFTANSKTLFGRLTDFTTDGLSFKAVSAEDVLAKLLSIIYPAAKGETIIQKYVEHFRVLLQAADVMTAQEIWRDYRTENQPGDFNEAVKIVEQSIAADPNLLQDEEYCQNMDFECRWCIHSDDFPLAPRSKIYGILGYI